VALEILKGPLKSRCLEGTTPDLVFVGPEDSISRRMNKDDFGFGV
jgi:hypothetical protein